MIINLLIFLIPSIFAIFLCKWKRTWRVLTHFITLIHELGHAIVGLLSGSKLIRITLSTDTSGLTTSHSAPGGRYVFGRMLTLFAGYTAPMVLGSSLVWLSYVNDSRDVWLWLAIASLISTIVFMNNILSFTVSGVFSGICALIFFYVDENFSQSLLILLSVFFFYGGYLRLYSTVVHRRRKTDEGSDMQQLRHLSGLPVRFWELSMAIVGIAIPLTALWYYLIY